MVRGNASSFKLLFRCRGAFAILAASSWFGRSVRVVQDAGTSLAMNLADEDASSLLQVRQHHRTGSQRPAISRQLADIDSVILGDLPVSEESHVWNGTAPIVRTTQEPLPSSWWTPADADRSAYSDHWDYGAGSSSYGAGVRVTNEYGTHIGFAAPNAGDGIYNECMPKCSWQCSDPKCDEVCKPKCQPPRCETRCAAVSSISTNGCKLSCGQPQCAVVCPKRGCPSRNCPMCMTQCSRPMCKLHCPDVEQQCREVCENPACTWECSAPESCPRPSCRMHCERKTSCLSNTYTKMPVLGRDEIVVGHFEAPIRLLQESGGVRKQSSKHTMSVPIARAISEANLKTSGSNTSPTEMAELPIEMVSGMTGL